MPVINRFTAVMATSGTEDSRGQTLRAKKGSGDKQVQQTLRGGEIGCVLPGQQHKLRS